MAKIKLIEAIASILFITLPVQAETSIKLPELTGPYNIGVKKLSVIDQNRLEAFTPEPGDKRRIGLQIWYPSEAAPNRTAPSYLDGITDKDLLENKVPRTIIPALRSIKTRAIPDAPHLQPEKKFPVLCFSPGYGGNLPRTHVIQMEEFASHGYVVVGIIHLDPDTNITSKVIKLALQERVLDLNHIYEILKSWGQSNSKNPLYDVINLEKVGIFGHSMGGTTAGEVVFRDPRFDAGISLDGEFSRQVTKQGLRRPFMLINQYSMHIRERTQKKVYQQSNTMMYSASFKGAGHDAFTDIPFLASLFPKYNFSPLLSPLFATPEEPSPKRINPKFTIQTINQYTLAFFDRHLKGKDTPFLNQPPQSPSVVYKFRNGQK